MLITPSQTHLPKSSVWQNNTPHHVVDDKFQILFFPPNEMSSLLFLIIITNTLTAIINYILVIDNTEKQMN